MPIGFQKLVEQWKEKLDLRKPKIQGVIPDKQKQCVWLLVPAVGVGM